MNGKKTFRENEKSISEFLAQNKVFAFILAITLLAILLVTFVSILISEHQSERENITDLISYESILLRDSILHEFDDLYVLISLMSELHTRSLDRNLERQFYRIGDIVIDKQEYFSTVYYLDQNYFLRHSIPSGELINVQDPYLVNLDQAEMNERLASEENFFARTPFIDEEQNRLSKVLYSPFYDSPGSQLQLPSGFIRFDVDLGQLMTDYIRKHISNEYYVTVAVNNELIYPFTQRQNINPEHPEPKVTTNFTFLDQYWLLTVSPRESISIFQTFNFLNLFIGLLIIAAISWLTIKLISYTLKLRNSERILKEKENQYRLISENSPNIIIQYDKDLRHIYINPIFEKYTGIDPKKVMGKSIKELTNLFPGMQAELDKWTKMLKRVMKSGESEHCDYLFEGTNGTYYFNAYVSRVFDYERRTNSIVAIVRDVTAQKEKEKELFESEQRFLALAENIPGVAVIGYDRERKVIYWNNSAVDLYGYKKDEVLGKHIEDLIIIPEKKDKFVNAFNKWLQTGKKIDASETVHKDRKGSSIEVFSDHLKIENIHGELEFYTINTNLTEYKKVTNELESEKELMISLFDNIDEMIYVSDLQTGEVLFKNKFIDEQISDKQTSKKCYEAFREKKDPCFFEESRIDLSENGKPVKWEHYDKESDCYYLITDKLISWKEGRKVKFTMIMDITPFKQLEEILKTEKDNLYSTLESIGEGLIVIDTDGKITLMNKVAEDLTGWKWEEAEGMNADQVLVIIDKKTGLPSEKSVLNIIETDTIIGIVDNPQILSKDGSKRVVYVSGAPVHNDRGSILGDVIIFRDITSRKRIEEEEIKSQKLESLGTLAAGIAYDFNNLLSSLFGYIEMAMVFHNSKEKVAQYLSRALGIYERATGLTDKLITFSRRGIPEKKTVSISELLEETSQFALSGSKIRYSLELDPNLWLCDVDRTQILQVFNNLLINSMQAMPDGGKLIIKAENVPGSNAPEWTGKTSNYVKISVIDEGTGIPESYLDRIFDPFFTTKQQGSGLGLATAYSIVNKHQGNIDVSSVPGEGTTVNVFIPSSKTALHDLDTEMEKEEAYEGKILIMDDDPIISDTVRDGLQELGYTVITTANGSKALLIFEEEYLKGEPFDLLIFDLTVPGELGGLETLQILREKYPDIVAIASSGYLDNPVMSNPEKFGFYGKIEKPYHLEDLITLVHAALDDQK